MTDCNREKVKDNRHICTVDQLQEALEGHFTTESIILYHEPSMTEVETTAQQFTERLDRMLSMPDISLITSQGTPRPPWPKILSGLWLLPSTVYLPNWRKRDEA
ncbi:hypothetical protein RRG08_003872 [Elysia crispata]|uniref:Uncharacterized protein n=1 Tax=Elysia crispata TaxID=231223 RepID=A0AAE1DEI7_9GAST|nr:hypothetical protein RRG08_003872 [Elysia crispata]